MTRQITPFKDLVSVYKLYKYFKKEQPKIVHSHTPKAGTVAMLAAKLANVPLRLHTIAGLPLLEASGNKRRLLNFVEKITHACATHIYPNSIELKNIIIKENFCKPIKLKVVGNGSTNGIDTSYFDVNQISVEQITDLKNQLQIKENEFVFIFVGRLVKDKGINELVEAFQLLKDKTVKLLLVGPFENDLDPLSVTSINAINNNKNIISVGFQNDVRPYFAIANALVFPSYREGFPNVVMQAGAMGLPSIVTNINGCNEIIKENSNGKIIEVKNAQALLQAMNSLLLNKEIYECLKSNARAMIVNRFEQRFVWNEMLKEYKRVSENV
jgi:glycosyltransferase involved in cell wall biosynthesis